MVENNAGLGIDMERCTGCGACYNICPVSAIAMEENAEGFQNPHINKETCIQCGLCDSVCPIITPKANLNDSSSFYAASAEDEIRMNSSSGGIFPLLAQSVLEKGGVVCGAGFSDDFYSVKHIIVDNKEELYRLKGSKYVQSSTGYMFRELKKHLEKGRMVLFSGTPCQVAGFKSFLGKDYKNLLLIDVICHGVPSPMAYQKFLKTVLKTTGMQDEKIVEVSFRNKKEWGWAPSVYVRLENGYVYSKSRSQTSYYDAFLKGLNCRKSCGDCQFNCLPRVGDLTLGDFWGLSEEKNDRKGMSVVSVNNGQGKKFWESIQKNLKQVYPVSLESAKTKNGNLVSTSHSHSFRKRFFRLLNQYENYDKVVEYASKRKFDIGYVGWWYGKNYGSILTNYALHSYLESLNYSVLMLEWPLHEKPVGNIEDSFARRFAKKHYEISIRRTYGELPNVNQYCDMFVVGSDQLWNYWSTKDNGTFFFLNFVEDSKKKIAYATSFGHPTYGAPEVLLKEAAFHMNRFDHVSVREKEGVDICRETFGKEAVCNIDPVFLCDEKEYRGLIREARVQEKEKYIFAYILTPSPEKKKMIENIARKFRGGVKIVLVLDASPEQREKNKAIMDMPEALKENLELEDWLYYIANAELVLTDSYHGLCFSLIFRKQFICIANILRGLSRFTTLLETAKLEQYMFFDPLCAEESEIWLKKINYKEVWGRLEVEIVRSKAWLAAALKEPKAHCASTYDLLVNRIRELEREIHLLRKELTMENIKKIE